MGVLINLLREVHCWTVPMIIVAYIEVSFRELRGNMIELLLCPVTIDNSIWYTQL